jgi:hypothetical protein
MEEILKEIKRSTENRIKLFFVKKIERSNGTSYEYVKSKIDSAIGKDLKTNAITQIEKRQTDKIIGYDILPCIDEDAVIETLPLQHVPHLLDFITGITNRGIKLITKKDLSKIHGYIVRIENEINTIYLFKKNTPKRLLEKGKIAYFFGDEGQFSIIDEQIITIEKIFDAAVLIPNPKDPLKLTTDDQANFYLADVYIFYHSPFETFFDFKELFYSKIETNRDYLGESNLIDSVETLIDSCKSDTKKIKKLARIITEKKLNTLDINKIKMFAEKHTNVKFSDDNKMKVTTENIWEVLHLLNDDYGKSEITDRRYKMGSKSEIQ